MIFLLGLALFIGVNQDFFQFEIEMKNQGYEWRYVGKTLAEPGYPHLEVYESGEPYYYYQLVKTEENIKNK